MDRHSVAILSVARFARVVFKKVSSTNFLNEIVEKGNYLTDMLKGINQQINFLAKFEVRA